MTISVFSDRTPLSLCEFFLKKSTFSVNHLVQTVFSAFLPKEVDNTALLEKKKTKKQTPTYSLSVLTLAGTVALIAVSILFYYTKRIPDSFPKDSSEITTFCKNLCKSVENEWNSNSSKITFSRALTSEMKKCAEALQSDDFCNTN